MTGITKAIKIAAKTTAGVYFLAKRVMKRSVLLFLWAASSTNLRMRVTVLSASVEVTLTVNLPVRFMVPLKTC